MPSDPLESYRFWSDDFDMDLPKVLPEVWRVIDQAPTTPIYTFGHRTHGRLNHPAVWNDYDGIVAYFGFDHRCGKPSYCVTGNDAPVECTFAEACRDAWPHHYRLMLEGCVILDTNRLVRQFDALMYQLRGWRDPLPSKELYRIEQSVARVFTRACLNFSMLAEMRNLLYAD